MSVVFHQDAIDRLLQSDEVKAFVERKAREITQTVQGNVRNYFDNEKHPAPDLAEAVAQDVDYTMDGVTAVVGIRDKGSKSRRLADKGILQDWLTAAKEAARE